MDPSERSPGENPSTEAADSRAETAGESEAAAEETAGEAEAAAGTETSAAAETAAETRGARFARGAHRTRLYLYAGAAVALLVFLVALVLANTGRVRVSWVFGASSVSLVWLVLFAAILGLLLGMVLGALFHWRTRAPRR